MEELKIIIEGLSKMGDSAQTAFIVWCIKDLLVYLVCPFTLVIIGALIKEIVPKIQASTKKYFG